MQNGQHPGLCLLLWGSWWGPSPRGSGVLVPRAGCAHRTARIRVFTAGMMSSKVRSQWEPFSSPLSSGGHSAARGSSRGLSPHTEPPHGPPCPSPPPQRSPSGCSRGLSRSDARKRVRSLKLQLLCTLLGLGASGTASVLGERCRGGARCRRPRLPRRCGEPRRMRSLMPILVLRGGVGGRMSAWRLPGGAGMGTGGGRDGQRPARELGTSSGWQQASLHARAEQPLCSSF